MIKKICVILGFTAAILAVILAVTPLSNFALAPIVIAFIFGLIVLIISKKQKIKTKTIQYIFLLVIISLSLTIYKSVIQTTEVGDIENLQKRNQESLEDSKQILNDITIDENF